MRLLFIYHIYILISILNLVIGSAIVGVVVAAAAVSMYFDNVNIP